MTRHASSPGSTLVIGTGASARLIARSALDSGLGVRLAGRRMESLHALASTLADGDGSRPDVLALDLADGAALDRALAGTEIVINTAGPFLETAGPLIEAALRNRVSYVDLANELPAVRRLLDRDADARDRGVSLVTGAGYGVAATEILARHLAAQLEDVARIELAGAPSVAYSTAGVMASVLSALPAGGFVYRHGEYQRVRVGSPTRVAPFGDGPRRVAAVPTGDLVAVQRATGADSVTVYSGELPTGKLVLALLPGLAKLVAIGPVRAALGRAAKLTARTAPPGGSPIGHSSRTWGLASSAAGVQAEGELVLGEGYAVTAAVAVACALATRGAGAPGAWTPGGLLGERLAECVGASIIDATED